MNKLKDYGSSWRLLRLPSITDQIYIKAQRIRNIEEKGNMKVAEDCGSEFQGIVNYSIIALIQSAKGPKEEPRMDASEVSSLFDLYIDKSKQLMLNKNHDYGEAWRDMRISSFTDLILVKLLRIKQIEDNQGQTIISEGIESNYFDILNYAVFALIKIKETK
ncbi:MAG TPA: DUF1599 domain-containing protein [Bacteroidia bacterium]|nr:DUF1599 domain-containing protein [Bacteroidia bacterium]